MVLDLPLLARQLSVEGSSVAAGFESALWLARLADTRTDGVSGGETIAQASPSRLVVVAERGDLLARRVGLLRGLVEDLGSARGEGAGLDRGAAAVRRRRRRSCLDEIARG